MKKVTITILVVLLIAMSFVGCQKSAASELGLPDAGTYPMTITDGNGNEVTLDAKPQTIISLAPSCTEILFAVGAGDNVVAVSDWCNYPEEAAALEKVGSTYAVNVERIVELDPDIVFVAGSFDTDIQATLESAGIIVYATNDVDMDDIYYSILAAGVMTDNLDQAEEVVAGMKADLEELQDAVANAASKKVFIDLGYLYTSSGQSFQGNLFGLINAENIALDYDISAPQLTAEDVIIANPDVYISMSPKEYFVQPDGFDEMNAFMNGDVYYVSYSDPVADLVSRPGPRIVEGLKVFAIMIYPELELTSDYVTDLSSYK